MSKLSEGMLESFFDYKGMATQCRSNFKCLSQHLKPLVASDAAAPIGFPIVVENRDQLQKTLGENKIFCPVLWRFKKVPNQFDKSYWLSEHLLVIPCDYRYDEKDMQQIVEKLT